MLPSFAYRGTRIGQHVVTLVASAAMQCKKHHESDDDEDLVVSCATDLGPVGQGSGIHR